MVMYHHVTHIWNVLGLTEKQTAYIYCPLCLPVEPSRDRKMNKASHAATASSGRPEASDLHLEEKFQFLSSLKDKGKEAMTTSSSLWQSLDSGAPTARPRPDDNQRRTVEWHEGSHYYALKVATDHRFRIRHMPIPEAGSPWPMPQHYQPTQQQFVIDPATFKLHASGKTCDILDYSFRRILRNMFGDFSLEDSGWLSVSDQRTGRIRVKHLEQIGFLNVTVLKECMVYPTLEMDESCKLQTPVINFWCMDSSLELNSEILNMHCVAPVHRFLNVETFKHEVDRFYIYHIFPDWPGRCVLGRNLLSFD